MSVNGKYLKREIEFLERNGNGAVHGVWTTNGIKKEDKVYTYDEALDLAGTGYYTYGLVAFLALAFQGMTLDMFGFSVVLTGACDMNLSHDQKSVLLSMPLIGSIVMAWPWGYIADTKGRRRALTISLWGSFILSAISAFSPHWIVLAVLKFGSSSLASGTQSIGFTLLGECCSHKKKAPFLIIVTTSFIVTFGVYTVLGYLILNLEVSADLGFITFSNWRLLILVFAMPLGISAALLGFFLESPKFLLNAGYEKKAIDILKNIMKRNGGDATKYPVKRIILNETTAPRHKNLPLWQSLRDQTFPIFKPPLLYRTLQLFYITATIYSSNNGFFVWTPFVVDAFYSGYNGNGTSFGICDMIVKSNKLNRDMETCVGTVKELVLWMSIIQALVYSLLNMGLSWLSRWKKSALIAVILVTFACGVLVPVVGDRMASMILFNGFMVNSLCISIVFSYYVDIYPTSHRGMGACLGVMVARGSSLVGSSLVGRYIDSHCTTSFYAWSVYVFSGAVVSWFLPRDK